MGYRNLEECVRDLEKNKQLVRIETEVDPNIEVGAIQRRVTQAGGPALLFTKVKGTSFPMLGNLFGTLERTRFIFRDTLSKVQKLIQLKSDPELALRKPFRHLPLLPSLFHARPKVSTKGPVIQNSTRISALPQLKSWPEDGGAFITLPQVYTESAEHPGLTHSNLGMYRIQISGNQYTPDQEIGLHYQLHRGIGVHHQEALAKKIPFRVNIFVGGTPAMTLAAVMPLPEGLSELGFAGVLAGHRIPMIDWQNHLPIYAEADFCISGTVIPNKLLPEGPFGDHLGYYSLKHDYPVLRVDRVFYRNNAIWPFTTVGRPPQEDSIFGEFIHELTGPLIPTVIPGVREVHAVDAAGVHPLLLAIGSERYVPYLSQKQPQEILTQANAILGQGQLSLAKYLWITAPEPEASLKTHLVDDFFSYMLERIDFTRDLHFFTKTTIDTLDYSGTGIHQGSKLILAACGRKIRELAKKIPDSLILPPSFHEPQVVFPGVLAIQGPQACAVSTDKQEDPALLQLSHTLKKETLAGFPLIVVVDDSRFVAQSLQNFLWVTFTRSNPSHDIYGIEAFTEHKHWGCHGSLIIDARLKPHHAKPLEEDPIIEKKVDLLGAPGQPLHRII